MAKTAVVNRRRRKKRRSNPRSAAPRRRRRRRNYGAAAAINPRRRRRARRAAPRRRRNPISPYSSAGYYRRPNPGFSFNEVMDTVPAATAGVFAGRFALKQAGAWEPGTGGVLEPGLKQALALWAAAEFGGELVDSMFGHGKGQMARIACYGFAGDLFLRAKFMRDSDFVKNNLSLQGIDDDDYGYQEADPDYSTDPAFMSGFQAESALGAPSMTDAFGNRFVSTPQGWQLAGAASGAQLAGFSDRSALGMSRTRPSTSSSFGYSSR
jgi:hypothetical protein